MYNGQWKPTGEVFIIRSQETEYRVTSRANHARPWLRPSPGKRNPRTFCCSVVLLEYVNIYIYTCFYIYIYICTLWTQRRPENALRSPKSYPKHIPRRSGWIYREIRARVYLPGVDQIADTLRAKLDTMGFASCEVKCLVVAKVLTT